MDVNSYGDSAGEWQAIMSQQLCEACGQPVRWSTSYDEPHWVHVKAADILSCPLYASAR